MRTDFYARYFELEDRHWWFAGRRRIVLSTLEARLGPDANSLRILDFGCGTGTMLGHLRRFGEAQGVDGDSEAIRFCLQRGEDQVQLSESAELPFAADSFDLVTTLDVLEHIEDDAGAAGEIRRVLRPGGTLLATVPAHQWMWGAQDEISHHFRRYSATSFSELISGAGFRLDRLTYFNSLLFPPIAAVRLARRGRQREGPVQSDFELTRDGTANRLLARLFASEAAWLRRRDLPFGVSLMALASATGHGAERLASPGGDPLK